jgi:hypothetical protein
MQIEPYITCKKYKGSDRMSLLYRPISQPSLNISSIWTPVITAEVKKLRLHQVYIEWENLFFLCWSHKEYYFSPVISNVTLLWRKASCVWSFNNLMFS